MLNKSCSPCVGIIIPIYNVAPYLRECLDSVINQTYKNLQIILVDDGSTDESFSIAKEYFDTDERIVLIKKSNRGLSHTRNIGLDYLANSTLGGGVIQILEHSSVSHKNVEYIHFLDSDDWFKLDCIETCVKHALTNQAEIVWHSFTIFHEENKRLEDHMFFYENNFLDGELLSGLQVFQKLKFPSFSWTWPGLINYKKIKKMRFEEGIESEDAIFGMQLFALCTRIYINSQSLMFYRVRPNSISQHTLKKGKNSGISFPLYQKDIVDAFNEDAYTIRHYSFAYSCAMISLRMDEFIQNKEISREMKEILKTMIEERAFYAFGGLSFEKDPRNVRKICSKLLPYTSKVRWTSKIAYHYPRIFKFLKKLKRN